jgi:hypothetical protein
MINPNKAARFFFDFEQAPLCQLDQFRQLGKLLRANNGFE